MHKEARRIILERFRIKYSREPSLNELQTIQSIALYEGAYGLATKPAGWELTNNWGAIQCALKHDHVANGCFLTTDHTLDGKPYNQYFKVYPTREAGCDDFIAKIKFLIGKGELSADDVADLLIKNWYFGDPKRYTNSIIEKKKKTVISAVQNSAKVISSALNEVNTFRKEGNRQMDSYAIKSYMLAIASDYRKTLAEAKTIKLAYDSIGVVCPVNADIIESESKQFDKICSDAGFDSVTGEVPWYDKLRIFWISDDTYEVAKAWRTKVDSHMSRCNSAKMALKAKGEKTEENVLIVDPPPQSPTQSPQGPEDPITNTINTAGKWAVLGGMLYLAAKIFGK